LGHPLLVKQPPLGRRPARRPPRGLGLSCFRIQVGEDLLDDLGILDARNDPHCSAADRTGLDVDAENPLEALRPSHRGATFRLCRRLRIRGRGTLTAPAPLGRRHPRAVFAVRCKHPMKASEVDPRLGLPEAASRAMKSSGSKMTWVVPSRYGVFSWYRTLPFGVSDRRFSAIAGRLMYRHSRSSFWCSSARAATPACSENPATFPTPSSNGSSHAGSVCSVNTLRPWLAAPRQSDR